LTWNSNLNCNSSRYSHISNIKSIYQRTSNLKLSGLFFDVRWYIDLIFGLWLYLDELQFKFEFRSGRMAIAHPNIIRPERNLSLNCNSSRYSKIPNIKSIYQRTSRKCLDNLKFEQKYKLKGTSFDIFDLIFGMWLYLDELQFKFEFGSGRMTFGWVMTL
jgi:hypothetical protein